MPTRGVEWFSPRVPLLDHPLIEFAAALPPEQRVSGRATKVLFKEAMRGILPDEVIDRPKHGFAVPLARWFRGDLRGYLRDVLGDAHRKARVMPSSA